MARAKIQVPDLNFTGTPSSTTFLRGDGTWNIAETTPDATTTVKGIVKLAGDLGGTGDLPTVPALADKAPLASPTFTGTLTAPTIVKTGGTSAQFLMADGSTSSGGGSDSRIITKVLTANQSATDYNSINISELNQTLGIGVYQIRYTIPIKLSTTTTSMRFDASFTGTSDMYVGKSSYPSQSAGILGTGSTQFNIYGSAKNTLWTTGQYALVSIVGCDIADSVGMVSIEATISVTASGSFNLIATSWNGTSVPIVTIMDGSSVVITKVD